MESHKADNFSAEHILDQLQYYFLLTEQTDSPFFKAVENGQGFCNGFTILFLYCAYLQTQPKRISEGKEIARDDLDWWFSIMKKISQWDREYASLSESDHIEINRFAQHILFLFTPYEFLFETAQFQLDKTLEDTRDRKPMREYSLAGLFTANDLDARRHFIDHNKSFIGSIRELIFKKHRLVMIGSHDHAIGLFFNGETYTIFDSISDEKPISISENEFDDLGEIIFSSLDYDKEVPSILGICVFSFEENNELYPSQDKLLTNYSLYHLETMNRRSPLQMSVYVGCETSYTYHLRHGAFLNYQDSQGESCLHTAIGQRNLSMVDRVIRDGIDLNMRNHAGFTPLGFAVARNDIETVARLLQAGVDVNDQHHDKFTLLQVAIFHKVDMEVLKMLLDAGAYINSIPTEKQLTALDFAILLNNIDAIELLLERGASVNVNGKNTLCNAIESGNPYIVEQVLNADLELDILREVLEKMRYDDHPNKMLIDVLAGYLPHTETEQQSPKNDPIFSGMKRKLTYFNDEKKPEKGKVKETKKRKEQQGNSL